MDGVVGVADWVQSIGLKSDDIHQAVAEYLSRRSGSGPFIAGVCGSVSVGKSTFSQALAEALATRKVQVVSTDGFLLPNRELEARGIMHRKGFPESYDTDLMARFLDRVRRREAAEAPIYSHEVYDVTQQTNRVEDPGIVIFEGVAAMLIPGTLDFSIYLDAEPEVLEIWFLRRVLTLRDEAKPETFYWHFREIPRDEFTNLARNVWREVNLVNLNEHILPKRDVADLVLRKAADHRITHVIDRSNLQPRQHHRE